MEENEIVEQVVHMPHTELMPQPDWQIDSFDSETCPEFP